MTDVPAVVVGLCAHGLAIARSLSAAGFRVLALEANRSLPGVHTKCAEVIFIDDINGRGLPRALIQLAPTISENCLPVLILTNDTMVTTIAEAYDVIAPSYNVSWGPTRFNLVPLLRKANIEQRCRDLNMSYPISRLIRSKKDFTHLSHELTFPIIFKPDKPVSSYKTLLIENETQLDNSWTILQHSLPAIAQAFVPGDDSAIQFGALYLDHGEIIARFEGRKLKSRPMGHTTVAISQKNDRIHDFAKLFFSELKLSGPVSLEMKEGPDGRLWVIEPTVGRTDFWVGLCIHDGVNFPLIEYRHSAQTSADASQQSNDTVWLNGERDPTALIWLLLKYPRYVLKFKIVGVYLSLNDFRPWLKRIAITIQAFPVRILNKLRKTLKVAFER